MNIRLPREHVKSKGRHGASVPCDGLVCERITRYRRELNGQCPMGLPERLILKGLVEGFSEGFSEESSEGLSEGLKPHVEAILPEIVYLNKLGLSGLTNLSSLDFDRQCTSNSSSWVGRDSTLWGDRQGPPSAKALLHQP